MHSRSRLRHAWPYLAANQPRLRLVLSLAVLAIAAFAATAAPARAADPVVAAAADIACDPATVPTGGQCQQQATSDLIVNSSPAISAVVPVGDLQYECGGTTAWAPYDTTWGRLKSITFPVPGNHEYNTAGGTDCDLTGKAGGYFNYWAGRTLPTGGNDPAKGYYSYNLGAWHVVALNTGINCNAPTPGCRINSVQERWLKADLAKNKNACTLAYFHYPVFSSKLPSNAPRQMFQDLYDAGAEVVLSGHVHAYERFAPQAPNGVADPLFGVRQFTIGTGGRSLEVLTTVAPNSEARGKSYGILKLTLHPTSYDWQFVPIGTPGNKFTDSGTTACHGAPDRTGPVVSVTSPLNGAIVTGATTISANAVDPAGIGKVDFYVDTKLVGTDTTAPYSVPWDSATVAGGSHTITARAFDLANNVSAAAITVTVNNFIPVPPGGGGTGTRASSNIFRVLATGGRARQVTRAPNGVDFDAAAWSRNGRLIAFSGAGKLFLVTPGGGAQRSLDRAAAGATRPSWGRLDRQLAFVGGSANSVFTISSRGVGQRRLTAGRVAHDHAVFSPNGRQIAFTTQQLNGGWDILVMNANGSGKRNLTRSLATELQPSWSHDGTRIAFARRIGTNWALYVMTVANGKLRRLTAPAFNCQQPAWSPNDRQIACARFSATGAGIFILRANGRVVRKLGTGTSTAWAPSWSPDGRRIAFTSIG